MYFFYVKFWVMITVDLNQDLMIFYDEDIKRDVPFFFIDDDTSDLCGCLAMLDSRDNGFEYFKVCPFLSNLGKFFAVGFIDALKRANETKYNGFVAWFKKAACISVKRSLVSKRYSYKLG